MRISHSHISFQSSHSHLSFAPLTHTFIDRSSTAVQNFPASIAMLLGTLSFAIEEGAAGGEAASGGEAARVRLHRLWSISSVGIGD